MNGFDLLLLGILTLAGGAILIVQGWRRASRATTPVARGVSPDGSFELRPAAVRHAHNMAGVRWMTIGAVAFVLAVTRERDTMFLVETWENVLMPLTVLTVALVITSGRADRAGRRAAERHNLPQAGTGTSATKADAAVCGRLETLKRKFSVRCAPREAAGSSTAFRSAATAPFTQCPEDRFWTDRRGLPDRSDD